MRSAYLRMRRLALAVVALAALAASWIGWLSHTPAGGAPEETSSPFRIHSRQRMIRDREEGQLLIDGKVVVRIRTSAAGYTAFERARMAAQRLRSALEKGAGASDLAVRRINQQVVITIADSSLITVDDLHAAINGTTPEKLAEIWMERIRGALVAGSLNSAFGSPFDAAALAAGPTELPVTWETIQNIQEGYWEAQAAYPEFEIEEGSEAPGVDFVNDHLAQEARSAVDAFVKEALETVSQSGKPTAAYTFDLQPTIVLSRRDLISVLNSATSYTGGAHGNTAFTTLNYALSSDQPRRIHLQDLFKPGVDAPRVVSDILVGKLKNNPQASFVHDGTVKELGEEVVERFVIHPDALIFLFQPYEVAPYAAGSFMVKVPFSELGNRLKTRGPLKQLLRELSSRETETAQAEASAPSTPETTETSSETPIAQAESAAPPTPEPPEPLANKFVPILSVGRGLRVGVARVSGPQAAVDRVKAVAQIEGEFKRVVRARAFVPVATEEVLRDLERVSGVSVTGYADLRF